MLFRSLIVDGKATKNAAGTRGFSDGSQSVSRSRPDAYATTPRRRVPESRKA
jgi:hypothetical protein